MRTIWYMIVRDGVVIDAPAERVWAVFTDVERWPEWTASVTDLQLVAGDGIAPGARARIKQPRFPSLVWEVTAVEPGRSWTWVSRSPGATTTATHELHRIDDATTRVEQVIEQTGVLGALVGLLTRRLTRRYLAMEAAGLKARSEAGVTTP
jgi:hypothetical protein